MGVRQSDSTIYLCEIYNLANLRNMKTNSLFLIGTLLSVGVASAQIIQEEPNDSIGTATPSTLVAGSSGGVFSIGNNGDGPFGPTSGDSTGDFDFFAIPANTGQVIVVDVNANINGSTIDSFIALYDDVGNLMESNDDDGTSGDSFINFTATEDRIYYAVVTSWVPGPENIPAESLPSDPNTAGTGQGAPGGGIDDYEVVILLDGSKYLTRTQPLFPLGNAQQVTEGSMTLNNAGLESTTISAIDITGEGAGAYATTQTFPLTIPPGGAATINFTFDPGGSLETFEAALEIVSDDIIHPTLSVPLAERASGILFFRLPFDDPPESATATFGVPAEVSGNNIPAALLVNTGAPVPIFGRPPLAGDEGFSTFFNDDGRSGNFAFTGNNFPHPASFTYSLWVRPTAGTNDDVLFNRNGAFTQQDAIYGCSITTDGRVVFRINNTEIVASQSGTVPDDETHHIVVTHLDSDGFGDFSADRTRLYLDGVMVAENRYTMEVPQYVNERNSRLWIASRSAAGQGFNGDIDEFQFYNIELNEEQVARLFSNPTTPIVNNVLVPPVITNIVRIADKEEAVITFHSLPGLNYELETSADLNDWSQYLGDIESQGNSTTVVAPLISADTTELFFRIVLVR